MSGGSGLGWRSDCGHWWSGSRESIALALGMGYVLMSSFSRDAL